MHVTRFLLHATAWAGLACACSATQAAPVQFDYSGTVTGHVASGSNLIAGYLPLGTAMTLSVRFTETFSDGTYSFADDLGPVSGQLQIGTDTWVLDGEQDAPYATDVNTGAIAWVGLHFTGSGPAAPGSDGFFGLFVYLTPALTLAYPVQMGFDYAPGPNGWYQYATFSGSGSVAPVGTVPVPATPALVATALLALALTRRRPA